MIRRLFHETEEKSGLNVVHLARPKLAIIVIEKNGRSQIQV